MKPTPLPLLQRTLRTTIAVLALTLTSTVIAPAAFAAPEAEEPPLPNWREPFAGEPFFLLTDATYGSAEKPRVRLEVNNPQSLAQVGGVDVVVYRIPDPLAFLQKQRNLHRVQVEALPAGEGLANTLTHLWDNWVVKARLAWQKLFSAEARRAVTTEAPVLKTPKALTQPSAFEEPRPFRTLPGLPVVERLRYPVHFAQPIAPPKDLKLAGSSSEFIKPTEGNVLVPLAAKKPGLYLVEASAGQHRAVALLFVSDTMAVTKVSGQQMLVWSAHRDKGLAVPGVRVVWTDGIGVLKSGTTDGQGLALLDRAAPEQTYVFGVDPAGGVFISENFYYDSEIYNAKVYAVTDRPLYRPGDVVSVKVSGREFKSSRESAALPDGEMQLLALDPAGQVVATQALKFTGASGADGRFQLPDNAAAGGYELRLAYRDQVYTAAFRVADYQKPHFEILLLADKPDFKTGDKVSGKLQLNYPDGKPVANARISLTARVQALSMVEGELDYSGAFAAKLAQDELVTDGSGVAAFALPEATQPSRYVLTALATDGAAYRVRVSRELLVERGVAAWRLQPQRQFSRPGESTGFTLAPSQRGSAVAPAKPARWEWLRLEDRSKDSGAYAADAGGSFALTFKQPGSYTLTLRDEAGRIVAATSHWVSGEGQKAPAGSIGIVFDKPQYQAGDTASALVTFPDTVDQALLTLERDTVESAALLAKPTAAFTSERLNPTQWKVTLEVAEAMSPNITFSVAYVKNGDMVFQNQGLKVAQPRVALSFKPEREVYQPGETVNVELTTMVAGKPVAAEVAVGVVDEMIYVLQPEIAPTIDEFFYHPRRNNVRTAASLSFIGYDLATRKLGQLPTKRQVNERAVKVLERPRRDNVDTAAWLPNLRTDAQGKARFAFTMPDSLTRWRFTGRAIVASGDAAGLVGQQTAWVRSDKAFYAKWTAPDWQREGDKAQATVALFNQANEVRSVEWQASGAGVNLRETVKLKPGANFVTLPLAADKPGREDLTLTLRADGKVVDTLRTPLRRQALAWSAPRELVLDVSSGSAALALPADARRVRVTLAPDAASAAFSRWLDELADDPYGCVEQTASRLLPLSLALQSLSTAQQPLAPMLSQRIATARLALAQMAGPQAQFGWWGRGMANDAFLTAYAYYADWRATQALRVTLPEAHWQRLLDVYAKEGVKQPPLQRALALHWMAEMGLPVGTLQAALLDELMAAASANATADAAALAARRGSVVMALPGELNNRDIALVLTAFSAGPRASAAQRSEADAAAQRLAAVPAPLVQSLLVLARAGADRPERARALLAQVRGEQPTFDRAQALVWLHKALGARPELRSEPTLLGAPWLAGRNAVGDPVWTLPDGQKPPATLALSGAGKAAVAFVSYDSSEASPAPALPVRIERTLFKVVSQARPKPATPAASAASGAGTAPPTPADDGRLTVKLEPVAPGTPLDSNALYLDQITLKGDKPMRWALLEAALPPGATVEASTWGLDLQGADGKTQALERATHQPIAQGYAVPVEALAANQEHTVRHLLRFSQRGQYKLPPARLFRMYEPEAKAVEANARWASVEVK